MPQASAVSNTKTILISFLILAIFIAALLLVGQKFRHPESQLDDHEIQVFLAAHSQVVGDDLYQEGTIAVLDGLTWSDHQRLMPKFKAEKNEAARNN